MWGLLLSWSQWDECLSTKRGRERDRRTHGDSWTSYVSSVMSLNRNLTITVYKVLQGLEGSGLAGGVGLLLVFL